VSALVATLPLFGILVGAILQYFFGRTLELRKHAQLQKGQAYADYFRAFAAIATIGRTKDTLANLTDAKARICVYGSKEVIARLAAFERSGASTADTQSRALVEELLRAMRRDVGTSTGIAIGGDLSLVLFGPPRT